jgi:hypothetical protein
MLRSANTAAAQGKKISERARWVDGAFPPQHHQQVQAENFVNGSKIPQHTEGQVLQWSKRAGVVASEPLVTAIKTEKARRIAGATAKKHYRGHSGGLRMIVHMVKFVLLAIALTVMITAFVSLRYPKWRDNVIKHCSYWRFCTGAREADSSHIAKPAPARRYARCDEVFHGSDTSSTRVAAGENHNDHTLAEEIRPHGTPELVPTATPWRRTFNLAPRIRMAEMYDTSLA